MPANVNTQEATRMRLQRAAWLPFLAVGIAFLVIGPIARLAFKAVGIVFIVLAIVFLVGGLRRR
jgi:hypothetical protein